MRRIEQVMESMLCSNSNPPRNTSTLWIRLYRKSREKYHETPNMAQTTCIAVETLANDNSSLGCVCLIASTQGQGRIIRLAECPPRTAACLTLKKKQSVHNTGRPVNRTRRADLYASPPVFFLKKSRSNNPLLFSSQFNGVVSFFNTNLAQQQASISLGQIDHPMASAKYRIPPSQHILK